MSLLLGLLVAFGRLSADREFVALQACGVSLLRLMRPVALLSVIGWARDLVRAAGRRAQRQPDISRDHLQHRRGARRGRGAAAGVLRGLPRPRDLRPRDSRHGRRLERRLHGRQPCRASRRPSTWRATAASLLDRQKRTVEMVLEEGSRHTADPIRQVRGVHVQPAADQPRPRKRLSADRPGQGRARDVDCGAEGARRRG